MWAKEMRMDTIRLIASDLDATLLDSQSQLPPDFAETYYRANINPAIWLFQRNP